MRPKTCSVDPAARSFYSGAAPTPGCPSCGENWRTSHHVSPDRPEKEPNADAFGHNPPQPLETMKTLAVISILALLTITGAAYTDQRLTSEQGTAQRTN